MFTIIINILPESSFTGWFQRGSGLNANCIKMLILFPTREVFEQTYFLTFFTRASVRVIFGHLRIVSPKTSDDYVFGLRPSHDK